MQRSNTIKRPIEEVGSSVDKSSTNEAKTKKQKTEEAQKTIEHLQEENRKLQEKYKALENENKSIKSMYGAIHRYYFNQIKTLRINNERIQSGAQEAFVYAYDRLGEQCKEEIAILQSDKGELQQKLELTCTQLQDVCINHEKQQLALEGAYEKIQFEKNNNIVLKKAAAEQILPLQEKIVTLQNEKDELQQTCKQLQGICENHKKQQLVLQTAYYEREKAILEASRIKIADLADVLAAIQNKYTIINRLLQVQGADRDQLIEPLQDVYPSQPLQDAHQQSEKDRQQENAQYHQWNVFQNEMTPMLGRSKSHSLPDTFRKEMTPLPTRSSSMPSPSIQPSANDRSKTLFYAGEASPFCMFGGQTPHQGQPKYTSTSDLDYPSI